MGIPVVEKNRCVNQAGWPNLNSSAARGISQYGTKRNKPLEVTRHLGPSNQSFPNKWRSASVRPKPAGYSSVAFSMGPPDLRNGRHRTAPINIYMSRFRSARSRKLVVPSYAPVDQALKDFPSSICQSWIACLSILGLMAIYTNSSRGIHPDSKLVSLRSVFKWWVAEYLALLFFRSVDPFS